jgi:outer membrane protein OmpA-like peptidoglycan-associated protein
MLTKVVNVSGKSREEAEKPFWISYADLMTALMVLFLVVMSVALLAVTKTVTEREKKKASYDAAVEQLLDDVERAVNHYPEVTLDRERRVIDFGRRALFPLNDYRLTSEQARHLRTFVPEVLVIAGSPIGKQLLKRVVVEGFTDQTGTYLYNLNLSLQRSQSVLCALFAAPDIDEPLLSPSQLADIKTLFLVGGFSYNSARATADESRRVELRLELYGFGEFQTPPGPTPVQDIGRCALTQ